MFIKCLIPFLKECVQNVCKNSKWPDLVAMKSESIKCSNENKKRKFTRPVAVFTLAAPSSLCVLVFLQL